MVVVPVVAVQKAEIHKVLSADRPVSSNGGSATVSIFVPDLKSISATISSPNRRHFHVEYTVVDIVTLNDESELVSFLTYNAIVAGIP